MVKYDREAHEMIGKVVREYFIPAFRHEVQSFLDNARREYGLLSDDIDDFRSRLQSVEEKLLLMERRIEEKKDAEAHSIIMELMKEKEE